MIAWGANPRKQEHKTLFPDAVIGRFAADHGVGERFELVRFPGVCTPGYRMTSLRD